MSYHQTRVASPSNMAVRAALWQRRTESHPTFFKRRATGIAPVAFLRVSAGPVQEGKRIIEVVCTGMERSVYLSLCLIYLARVPICYRVFENNKKFCARELQKVPCTNWFEVPYLFL